VPPNSQKLRRYRAFREGLGDALLMIGTTVKMDPREKWMFAIATDAMNMNFV